jgi:thiol-disulfide isomerase/thioredoxin
VAFDSSGPDSELRETINTEASQAGEEVFLESVKQTLRPSKLANYRAVSAASAGSMHAETARAVVEALFEASRNDPARLVQLSETLHESCRLDENRSRATAMASAWKTIQETSKDTFFQSDKATNWADEVLDQRICGAFGVMVSDSVLNGQLVTRVELGLVNFEGDRSLSHVFLQGATLQADLYEVTASKESPEKATRTHVGSGLSRLSKSSEAGISRIEVYPFLATGGAEQEDKDSATKSIVKENTTYSIVVKLRLDASYNPPENPNTSRTGKPFQRTYEFTATSSVLDADSGVIPLEISPSTALSTAPSSRPFVNMVAAVREGYEAVAQEISRKISFQKTLLGKSIQDHPLTLSSDEWGTWQQEAFGKKDPLSGSRKIESTDGRYLVVDCWATWCAPCIGALPKLSTLHRELSASGVSVLSLCGGGERDTGTKDGKLAKIASNPDFSQHFDVASPMLFQELGIKELPTVFIVGPDNRIIFAAVAPTEDDLKEVLTPLIHKDEAPRAALPKTTVRAERKP